MDDMPGVTRDRHYGYAQWTDKFFTVIDTGGLVFKCQDVFEIEIKRQVQLAIEEANCIVFMTDATTGITDLDQNVTELLRKSNKQIFFFYPIL